MQNVYEMKSIQYILIQTGAVMSAYEHYLSYKARLYTQLIVFT